MLLDGHFCKPYSVAHVDTMDDFLLWYGRERGFEIWEEAGNIEDSDVQHVDNEIGPFVWRQSL